MVKMSKPLEYYFENGTHVIFNKYTIENGVIKNKQTGKTLNYSRNKARYNICSLYDDCGKRLSIRISRAIASTILGPPPTQAHTADHKDRNRENDTDENIRWLCKSGQVYNQERQETLKSAFVIIKDGIEKTANDWVDHLRGDYTPKKIREYARKRYHGFSYKEYPDLREEIWKEVPGSKSTQGRWEISNMSRVKYITKHAENVLSKERINLSKGYPIISFNERDWYCHILSFMTFYPEEYANKKKNEIVLHEDDNRCDFRPHKLRLGTPKENTTDAHDNGKYDGKKSMRMRCASYINDIFEKEYTSQSDAVIYLKTKGYLKADVSGISQALEKYKNQPDKIVIRYDRTWKCI